MGKKISNDTPDGDDLKERIKRHREDTNEIKKLAKADIDPDELADRKRKNAAEAEAIKEAKAEKDREAYAIHKDRTAKKRLEATRSYQDIGEISKPKDMVRRTECLATFELFCRVYGKAVFYLDWSDVQCRSAATLQQAADYGGWHAYGEPRGSGKTARAIYAGIWGILSGKHQYIPLIGATQQHGQNLLDAIKRELATNDLLLADFPHVCEPIRYMQGDARSAPGQRYKGEKTLIVWSTDKIVLPWVDPEINPAAGAVLHSFGLESAIRGLNHTRPDGKLIRPTLAISDDPQTRGSAKSPTQTQTRLDILAGDVGFLSGPDKPMAQIVPITVMYQNDLADQMLNRKTHPEWHGVRTKMVIKFPTNVKAWELYSDTLKAAQQRDDALGELSEHSIQIINRHYLEHRQELDEGCVVYWPARFNDNEVSAIQAAMNFKIRNEPMFWAECQNEPILPQDEIEMLSADQICLKVTGHERGVVPDECSLITAFTDTQSEHLFWMVVAWTPDFSGYVLDYGAWPDQGRYYFARNDIRQKLSMQYLGDESSIMLASLTELEKKLFINYQKQSGGELQLSKWCLDTGFRKVPITAFASQSQHRQAIALTRGAYIGARSNPLSESAKAKKWKTGHGEWIWSDGPGAAKPARFDANHWKKKIHVALCRPTGSKGSIQLFKADPQIHRMLADHILAESAIKVEAKGRLVYEFSEIPGRDNEGLDCIVGCAVAASISGLAPTSERAVVPKKPRSSMAQMAARARGKAG